MVYREIKPGFPSYAEIRKDEMRMIRIRRATAVTGQTTAELEAGRESSSVEHDLIGVALSGGGIRSAVFNLGFLQALSHKRFLGCVDYLCSVSGGGYVAGHVSALANSVAAEKNFHEISVAEYTDTADPRKVKTKDDERLSDLGVDRCGKLTGAYRFRHIGSYLFSDIAGVTWRYILFTAITALLVMSLIGVFATSAALCWRFLDLEKSRDVIGLLGIGELGLQLGIGDETIIAFMPAAIPFCLLVLSAVSRGVCHAFHYRRGRSWCAGWCRFWLRCWGISMAISFAVLFGNGEMSFSIQDSFTSVQSNLVLPLTLLFVMSLLPLIRFKSVINSARPEAPAWKGMVAIALATLTCGVGPFFMVFWMARENVSGFAQYRDPELLRNDIQDTRAWPAFIYLCQACGLETSQATRGAELDREAQNLLARDAVLGAPTWDAFENLPYRSLFGAWNRLSMLKNWLLQFPADRPAERWSRLSNPIATYENLLTESRTHFDNVMAAFNDRLLDKPSLTAWLVAEALGITKRPLIIDEKQTGPNFPTNHLFALPSNGKETPSDVREILTKYSREPDNLAGFWHRAMIDQLPLPVKKGSDSDTDNVAQFAVVREHLERVMAHWRPIDVRQFNRLLLEALFPKIIRPRIMISTTIVPWEDQRCRLWWLACWSLASVVLLCVDWNAISPFYVYYRNKLSRSFVRSGCIPPADDRFEERDLRLADLKPWMRGAPFPLMLASIHFFSKVSRASSVRLDVDPSDADSCQAFCLSPLHVGSSTTGWMDTGSYCLGEINLADAVALSGAAVTPFMISNLGITALMGTANLRIGQWLPLPASPLAKKKRPRASGWAIGRELWHSLNHQGSACEYLNACRMALVADGGFHEFFGLEELLLRRCRLVVVVDAGCNNGRYEFGALADALRMMRIAHGLQFLDLDHESPIDLSQLRRGDNALQPLHHCCFRVRYPEKGFPIEEGPAETFVVYAQMSLTGDEDLDLQQFRNVNPNFPDEPTTNQRYSQDQVESYRQLGYHIGKIVCGGIPTKDAAATDVSTTANEWIANFREAYVAEWKRQTGRRFPRIRDISRSNDPNRPELVEVDRAITEFLKKRSEQSTWYHALEEWLLRNQRPESIGEKGILPTAMQIAKLVLACEAHEAHGGRLQRESVFLPGGRSRLCELACRLVQHDSLAADDYTRRELIRDLLDVGLVSHHVESNADQPCPITPGNDASLYSARSVCLAAELLWKWKSDPLTDLPSSAQTTSPDQNPKGVQRKGKTAKTIAKEKGLGPMIVDGDPGEDFAAPE